MKKILLIFGILLVQTLYAFGIQVGPIIYSILSQEDLTVKVVGVNENYNETTLTIPAQIQYNDQTYTVIAIGNLTSIKSKTIEIPATVEEYSISNTSSNLAYIAVDEANPVFASVDGILYTKNLDTLIKCPPKRENEVKLPEGVKIIKEDAFSLCEKLENITLPTTLEEIGQFAFDNCNSLETIIIPNSVFKINSFAFACCRKLKSIKLSDSLEVLESSVFETCSSLDSIEIPSSVKELQSRVFESCVNLEYAHLPSSLEKINIPFANCPKLSTIIIDEGNPYFCAEGNCIFNKDKTTLLSYHTPYESVNLPEGIIAIGNGAFYASFGLTQISLPSTIEEIGTGAFFKCHDLERLIVHASMPPSLSSSAFESTVEPFPDPIIFVPSESVELYKEAPQWNKRKDKIFSIDQLAGFEEIQANDDLGFTVFSIQGLHILTTTNKDDLQNLPSGLYIINGKKFFLHN